MQLDRQKKQTTTPEDEGLPQFIWKELLQNPEDQKIWKQISSDGKKLIVASIPKDKSKTNFHVMKSVFINLVHTFIKDNNIEIAESDSDHDNSASSSSSRSTIDEHDYIINQAISNNKGGNKVHKASEMSPGNPARMMSSKEGRN